jgi:ATP-binding cassette subfamily C protein LapB
MPESKQLPSLTPGGQNADRVLDRLLFLARYYGRSLDAEQLTGGIPLPEGKVTETELVECAGRAGLAVTPADLKPGQDKLEQIKSSMLPALIVGEDGDAVVVLHRDGDQFECSVPGVNGSSWVHRSTLQAEHPGRWYFLRPVFHFDARSLLYHLPQPRRWFWDVFKANKRIYLWALLATVVINLLAIVVPFYSMAVYDRVVPNNALDSLWVLTSAVVAVTLFDLGNKLLRSYLLEAAARKADVALSSHIFAHSLRLRAANRPASGGVLANVVRDFETVRDFFTSTTLTLLGDLPFMLFFLAVIALIGGWLVLVPLVIIPLALGFAWWLRGPLGRTINENTKESATRTAHLFEVMNGLDTVKGLGAEAWARRKWEGLTLTIADNNMRMREISTFGNNTVAMLTGLNTVLLVMFGAMLVAANKMTLGQLIAVSMIASRAIAPVAQIAGLVIRWEQTKVALSALDKVMESPTDGGAGDLHVPGLRGAVEMRDVKFAYPDTPPLIKGMNLRIAPGEKVGFIGRIGSGKSTLMRMILNIYAPEQGAVLIDGVSVGQMDPLSLRRQIGYVPQDVTLFHGDIKENILLGSSDVSDARLLEAARMACLEDTLAQMPNGLATEVGERGERLSGGQRQAVAIARALVQKPRLLLLDEPSSMMDPATENQLIQNLRKLTDVTLLLVTHRTAMLPLVDRLVVMDQGRIVMDGPRDDVLKRLQAGAQSGQGAST